MYNPNVSYEENYQNGPQKEWLPHGGFPQIKYLGSPKYSFLGVPLYIPFGVPAGPLLNAKYMRAALEAGFCLPVYKTVRSHFTKSHPWPNVLRVRAADKSLFFTSHRSRHWRGIPR